MIGRLSGTAEMTREHHRHPGVFGNPRGLCPLFAICVSLSVFTATVPPSVGQDAENAMAGRPLGLSSLAENNPLAGKYI